jgi:glycosyltransferase involved in cell wall biosynthesis
MIVHSGVGTVAHDLRLITDNVTAMMTRSPNQQVVSVIIPCYNHAHFLGEAIESVINQTYPYVEIIVVDDGSTDDTAQIAKAYPNIHCVRQNNFGLSRARNVGLSYSKGTYITFLDADDSLFHDAIDIGLRALASRNDFALAFGLFVTVGSIQSMQKLSRETNYGYKELLQRNVIGNPGSALYCRWVFTEIGGFDEANSPAADYDLYLRATRQFPILCHHQLVVQYRRHGANMSNDVRLMLASTLTALKKQRSHVEKSRELRAAYDMGVEFWRNCYGEPLINRMYEQFAKGHLIDAALDGYTLVRFYPHRFLTYAKRMTAYLISFFRKEPPRS